MEDGRSLDSVVETPAQSRYADLTVEPEPTGDYVQHPQ